MKKHIKLFSNVALSTIILGMGLTCCSIATTLSAKKQIQADAPVPKEMLRFDDTTVYGFAQGVDIKQLYTGGYTRLDLSEGFLGKTITKIAPFAFANAFTGLECPINQLVLPEKIEEIGQAAFFECRALGKDHQLYLPNTLKTIGDNAFFYTGFNTHLTIPDGVEKIGIQAFWHIDTITGTIKIPSSVQEVGFRAFKDIHASELDLSAYSRIPKWLCKQGTIFQGVGGDTAPEVTVKVSTQENTEDNWLTILKQQGLGDKSKVESVDANPTTDSCFKFEGTQGEIVAGFVDGIDLSQYKTLQFPDRVTTIKKDAFNGQIKNHKLKFTMPTNITTYGDNAFLDCPGLMCDNMSVPVEAVHIGNNAFQNCTGITGTITFPQAITNDGFVIEGNEAFKGCTGITGLKVDNSDHFNGYGMFQGCSSLAMLDFSDYKNETIQQIEELWPQAEEDPNKHLPLDGMSKNGMIYYFEGGSLDDIRNWQTLIGTYLSNRETVASDDINFAKATKDGPLWQVRSKVQDDPLPDMDGFVLENKEICHGVAKKYKSEITYRNVIQIPNVVTTIASNAFKDVLIPKEDIDRWRLELNLGLIEIQDSAFENCYGIINQLVLPNTVESVGARAFYGCTNIIGSLILPKSVTSIGESSFTDTRINSIVIDSSITNIGANAFTQVNFVKSLDLTCFSSVPTTLTIGDNAFAFVNAESTAPAATGTVYVATGTKDAWTTLLQSKGLPTGWEVKEVA